MLITNRNNGLQSVMSIGGSQGESSGKRKPLLPKDLTNRGDRLRWVREEVLGYSLRQMEDVLRADYPDAAMSHNQIGRVEAGESPLKLEYLSALGEASGVPVDWILLNRHLESDAEQKLAALREIIDAPLTSFHPAPDTRKKKPNGSQKRA